MQYSFSYYFIMFCVIIISYGLQASKNPHSKFIIAEDSIVNDAQNSMTWFMNQLWPTKIDLNRIIKTE